MDCNIIKARVNLLSSLLNFINWAWNKQNNIGPRLPKCLPTRDGTLTKGITNHVVAIQISEGRDACGAMHIFIYIVQFPVSVMITHQLLINRT